MVRSFILTSVSDNNENINPLEGVYTGRGPGQAAYKAFNGFCKRLNLEECERFFTLQETTPMSHFKKFHYLGTRRRYPEGKTVVKGDTTYNVNYEVIIKKAVKRGGDSSLH